MLTRRGSAIALLLAGCASIASMQTPARAQPQDLGGKDLLDTLRQGGLVVYMRHGATNSAETDFWQQGGDWDRSTLDDCKRQRNLSQAGRDQARRMGQAIAKLKLNWEPVLASPYCRTRETAELAFGKGERSWDLFYHLAAASKRREDGDAILAAVRRLLSTPPAAGRNAVLVSHGGNLSNVASIYLAEGECAVFRPGPGGSFHLVGRIGPDDWAALAPSASRGADVNKETLQRRWVFRHVDSVQSAQGQWRRVNQH